MKIILIIWINALFLISGAVLAQDQYGFVHFPQDSKPTAFFENDHILLSGRLDDNSAWAILDVNTEEMNQLKAKYHTEFVRWNLRRGEICYLIDESSSSFTFVKYSSHITKFNVQDSPELFRLHDEHIKEISQTGNVFLEGYFNNRDGGFMIMRGTVQNAVILSDKAVENGIIEPEIHSTRLVKGKACNN